MWERERGETERERERERAEERQNEGGRGRAKAREIKALRITKLIPEIALCNSTQQQHSTAAF